MSGAVSIPPLMRPPAVERGDGRRLWRALATPPRRPQPAKGADKFGELVTGMVARRRARPQHRRAESILAASRAIESLSAAAFEDHAQDIAAAVRLHRDEVATVDAAFAACIEAIRRGIGFRLHPVQVVAALAMAEGCCAELATGEGKTVTAILPTAIDAWSGRGVHVVTVNDYLARRDAETTSPAYELLGLRVGVLQEKMDREARRTAYNASITYGADKQFIFDHLRDRLLAPLQPTLPSLLLGELAGEPVAGHGAWETKVTQRGHYAAVVDEADSVLIDEAVTPAIISASPADAPGPEHHRTATELAAAMRPDIHYTVDIRRSKAALTDAGRAWLSERSSSLPVFWSGPRRREEIVLRAIQARDLYLRGRDYIVRDDAVHIVDRSTGRVLPGRQWQAGLHQAVEAKEGVAITAETQTAARSSYQAYFQRYARLSGMSGTAWEVRNELWSWYRLPVVRIPTHLPIARTTARDRILTTENDKLAAVADRVAAAHAAGQPVLVGTWSITTSERLATLLDARGIACRVLNANRESEEAGIVESAGLPGAVTVATNMAGRGTDIRLTPETRAAGGLLVLATDRHDERRVDRQLFGRAGRQGDPGRAEAFVSFEDVLIRRHGLKPLVAAARALPEPARGLVARAAWRLAQFTASRNWASSRADAAKQDAWFDLAMHHATR